MRYVIKPSSTRALLTINGISMMCFALHKEPGHREAGDELWHLLPKPVQDVVLDLFRKLFAAPASAGREVDALMIETVVEIPDEDVPLGVFRHQLPQWQPETPKYDVAVVTGPLPEGDFLRIFDNWAMYDSAIGFKRAAAMADHAAQTTGVMHLVFDRKDNCRVLYRATPT